MARLILLLVLLAAAPFARACGYCAEDRMAAVYDHAIVAGALERRHEVAFIAVDGATATRRELLRAIDTARGIDRGTARVSPDGSSFSFAYDPRGAGLPAVVRAIRNTFAAKGVSFSVLRVIDATSATPRTGTPQPAARGPL